MNPIESCAKLLDPVKVGDFTLDNRVVLAPMTRSKASEGRLANGLIADYYAQRASAGLIITEATSVSPQGNGWVGAPGIYNDEQAGSWRQVVNSVHAKGGRIFLQLWHMGRASHSDFHDGALPVAPSAVRLNGDGVHTPNGKKDHEIPRALETGELAGVVADYVSAAERAREAGFDGVEIHSANGYLLDQFLQSRTNERDDNYGGSIENRFRLLREVVEGISTAIGASRVGVRLSPNGVYNDMGSDDYRKTFTYAAAELDKFDLAFLHVMDGLAFGFHEKGEPMTLQDFRAVYSGTLIGNCGYEQETAEAAVSSGAADLIAIGRPYLANPDLVERFRNNWPLAPLPEMDTWYAAGDSPAGYTEYPNYDPATAAAAEGQS